MVEPEAPLPDYAFYELKCQNGSLYEVRQSVDHSTALASSTAALVRVAASTPLLASGCLAAADCASAARDPGGGWYPRALCSSEKSLRASATKITTSACRLIGDRGEGEELRLTDLRQYCLDRHHPSYPSLSEQHLPPQPAEGHANQPERSHLDASQRPPVPEPPTSPKADGSRVLDAPRTATSELRLLHKEPTFYIVNVMTTGE